MDQRKDYTPTKTSKLYSNLTTTAQTYSRPAPDMTSRSGGEMALLKEYQTLKLQVKQLQVQNRQLSTEVEKLRYQKSFSQNKFLQKMSLQEEAIAQFQKEKNYQLQMLKIKGEEELSKARREHQLRVDDLHRQIKSRDYTNREIGERVSYLELKNGQLRKEMELLEVELIKSRQACSGLTERVTREQFANKKLQMLCEELERQKCEMEAQIHVLLDIEAEKSRTINSLEAQLRGSENAERTLQQKLALLTDNFASLQDHIGIMKERLLATQLKNDEVEKILQSTQNTLQQRDVLLGQQKQREVRLREELQQHQGRQARRQREVEQLMAQNERLYRQLNVTRHQLHEICINHSIDL